MPRFRWIAIFGLFSASMSYAEPAPRSLWDACPKCDSPESAYFDVSTGDLFTANVVGGGTDKDGNGTIARWSKGAKAPTAEWVKGLNGPKGMRAHGGKLYVADIDQIVVIDIKTASVEKRFDVPGAKFLNDVTIDPTGCVFVSDTIAGNIIRLDDGKASVFMAGDTLEGPNGLLVVGDELVIAAWGRGIKSDWTSQSPGHLYAVNLKTKTKRLITPKPLGHLDGLERDPVTGDFLAADWTAGKVFRINARTGSTRLILDGFKGAADIGFDPVRQILFVPRMGENKISAYDLSEEWKRKSP